MWCLHFFPWKPWIFVWNGEAQRKLEAPLDEAHTRCGAAPVQSETQVMPPKAGGYAQGKAKVAASWISAGEKRGKKGFLGGKIIALTSGIFL